jgi:tetratricopeptide (TPR) repeat protein
LFGLAALVGVCMARPTWREGDLRQMQRDVDRARQLVGQHRIDLGELVPLTDRLAEQATRHPDQAGEIEYLVGNLYTKIAERDPASVMIDAWTKARQHLEQAQTLGVAESDFTRLNYLLAKAWYHSGGDMQDVVEALERSIEGGADQPAEGYGLLTNAYLSLPTRDVEAALRANEKELSVPYVGEDLLAPARLLRGELLLELKRPDEARKWLASIGIQAPPLVLAKARYLRARSLQEEEHWVEAEKLWEDALEDRAAPPTEPARALYYLGVCRRNLGKSSDAARVWTECAKRGDADEAGPAALVQLAELQLTEPDPPPVLDTLTQAVKDVKGAGDWHNTLIDLNHVCEVFDGACERFRKDGRFDEAVRLATLYEPFAAEGKAEVQLGRAALEWGQRLAAEHAEEAQAKFARAGEAYDKASGLAGNPSDRVERLWLAAESFALAADSKRTIAAVEAMLDTSKTESVSLDPQHKGKALFLRAEAHRALGEDTLAQHYYGECISINFRTPYAYRARYQLAMVAVEQKKIDEARAMLEHNLSQLHLDDAPDREAQEKTLYALAQLLFNSGYFSAAVTHFKQALEKFGDNPEALRARFELAESYSALAGDQVKALAPGNHLSDAAAKHHEREYQRCFREAAQKYQEVANELNRISTTRALTPEEDGIFWQAQLLWAYCRHSYGEYAEALKLYQQLAERHKGKAQELYALRGVVGCYWSRSDPGDTIKAAQTVETIRSLLAKFTETDLKVAPDEWSRKQWDEWIQRTTRTPDKKP